MIFLRKLLIFARKSQRNQAITAGVFVFLARNRFTAAILTIITIYFWDVVKAHICRKSRATKLKILVVITRVRVFRLNRALILQDSEMRMKGLVSVRSSSEQEI